MPDQRLDGVELVSPVKRHPPVHEGKSGRGEVKAWLTTNLGRVPQGRVPLEVATKHPHARGPACGGITKGNVLCQLRGSASPWSEWERCSADNVSAEVGIDLPAPMLERARVRAAADPAAEVPALLGHMG